MYLIDNNICYRRPLLITSVFT